VDPGRDRGQRRVEREWWWDYKGSGRARRDGRELDAVDHVVEIDNLSKVYYPSPRWMRLLLRTAITSPVTALDGVSLSVSEGQVCAIVGPNGAGKSTLFRILTGLTTPSGGEARIAGIDVSSAPKAVRSLIGFVPAGDQTLYLRLSCVDNLMFHGQLAGVANLGARIDEVLRIVGLAGAADRVGFALSAGMRARLQLARAMLHRPRVLILDEPTAAVDPVGSYELLQVVERVAEEHGVAVLLSSHRLEEIEALGNYLVLMDRGRIAFAGDLDELRRRSKDRTVTLHFSTESGREAAAQSLRLAGVELLEQNGSGSRSISTFSIGAVGTLLARLNGLDDLIAVEETRASLRDVIYGVLQSSAPASSGGVLADR
jgi:ABC-2 type transport system ATP-binding protein